MKKASNRRFKAENFQLYFRNLYMKCFYFCQQYKDHFETAKEKGYKPIFFAILFL